MANLKHHDTLEQKTSAGQKRLDLAAITLGHRVHAGGAVAGIVTQDRAANLTAAKLVCGCQILHAPANIGLGVEEGFGRAAKAHHARRCRLDLHQPDLACAAASPRVELAFYRNDGMGQIGGDAVTLGIFDDQIGIVVLERRRQALFGNGITGRTEEGPQRHGFGLDVLVFGKSNPRLRNEHSNARCDSNKNSVHLLK